MEHGGERPLVTCIITTYKRQFSMIQESIESVRAQTYKPLEWIVVSDNDPKSDFARAVAEGMKAYPDGKLIQLPRNSGAQVARNTGILKSAGEFIACLDDDDIWTPDKTEKEMALFTGDDIGCAFCCGYICKDTMDNVTGLYRSPNAFKEYPDFHSMLYNDYIGTTSNPIIRRAVIAKVGLFDTELRAKQDYEMWIRISRHFRMRGTMDRLFYYRQHEGEQISKSPEVSIQSYFQLFRKYKRDYKKHREAASRLYFRVSRFYADAHHPFKAFQMRLMSFFWHPVRWFKLRLRYGNPNLYYRLTGEKKPNA